MSDVFLRLDPTTLPELFNKNGMEANPCLFLSSQERYAVFSKICGCMIGANVVATYGPVAAFKVDKACFDVYAFADALGIDQEYARGVSEGFSQRSRPGDGFDWKRNVGRLDGLLGGKKMLGMVPEFDDYLVALAEHLLVGHAWRFLTDEDRARARDAWAALQQTQEVDDDSQVQGTG